MHRLRHVLAAPRERITAGLLEAAIVPFYRPVFEGGNFISACDSHLAPHFSLFHSERLLLGALMKYVRRHCIGRGAALRREDVMSQAVASGLTPTHDVRRAIRDAIAPYQAMFDKFAGTFLMGKHPGFDIDDVMTPVRKVLEREQG